MPTAARPSRPGPAEGGVDTVVVASHQPVSERGDALVTLTDAEHQRRISAASDVDDRWVKGVSAKGADGQAMLEEPRALIARYDA
jgi:nitrogen fixation protein FixH